MFQLGNISSIQCSGNYMPFTLVYIVSVNTKMLYSSGRLLILKSLYLYLSFKYMYFMYIVCATYQIWTCCILIILFKLKLIINTQTLYLITIKSYIRCIHNAIVHPNLPFSCNVDRTIYIAVMNIVSHRIFHKNTGNNQPHMGNNPGHHYFHRK